MKRSLPILSIIFGMSNQFVYANLPATITQPIIKTPIQKEPLMVSHLPKNIAKRLSLSAPTSYASGHEFYDAKIELIDETGKRIIYKHQINPKHHYTLSSIGPVAQTLNNIWFFSPDGTDQVFENDWDFDKCTAENPCKQITQKLVDEIHARAPAARLWVAPGTYNAPYVIQQKLHPQLLELHHKQNIMGRTNDFKHFAYGKDRPLFLGTLSWSDYTHHEGISASVENIRVHTSNNKAQAGDTFVNTNLYSTGVLNLDNCSLVNSSELAGTNIYAQNVNAYQSSLKGLGTLVINIYTDDNITIQNSILKVKGSHVSSLSTLSGEIVALNSRFIVENESCYTNAIVSRGNQIFLQSSRFNIHSDGECEIASRTTALVVSSYAKDPYRPSWFFINDSKIRVYSKYGQAIGIMSSKLDLTLSNSKIKVQSFQSAAIGVATDSTIEFENKPSYLTVSSPVSADLFFDMDGFDSLKLLNNSNPHSQCVVNDTKEDCHL